jgi:hypothetical protein
LRQEGKVAFVATPTSQTYNFMGIAHGGYAATLLDLACGIAANSAAHANQLRHARTQNCLSCALDRPGGWFAQSARWCRWARGWRIEARLIDMAGKLYASATSTLLSSIGRPEQERSYGSRHSHTAW